MSILKRLSESAKETLNSIERKNVIACITIEVHARDIIDRITKSEVSAHNDFEWMRQLRFYFEKDEQSVQVCQNNASFNYGIVFVPWVVCYQD